MIPVSKHYLCDFLACTNDPDVLLNWAAGIVERVVLLGAPIGIKDESWEAARKVVGVMLLLLFPFFFF